MSSSYKNAMYFTVASVAQKIISFLYFTLVARTLGAKLTGIYIFALTFTTLFSILADLGISPTVNRETAKNPQNAQKLLSAALFAKMFLFLIAYILAISVVIISGYDKQTVLLVAISGITMLFDSLHLLFYAIFRGNRNLRFESFGIVGSQLLTLVIGSAALFLKAPLFVLIIAFTVPSILNAAYSAILLYKKYGIKPVIKYDLETIKGIINIAMAFGLAGIFSRIFSSLDSIILSVLAGTTALGLYSIPNKIAFAFQFIPLALVAAIFPEISYKFANAKQEVEGLFVKSMKYVAFIAFPLAFGVSALAQEIILKIYGQSFLNSIAPLRILMVAMIFSFISYPIGAVLNGCNKEKIQTTLMGITVLINITLNFLLVPKFNLIGTAYSALAAYGFLTIGGAYFVYKLIGIKFSEIFLIIIKSFICAVIMYFAVAVFKNYVIWWTTIPIGIFLYLIFAFGIKLITLNEIKEPLLKITSK